MKNFASKHSLTENIFWSAKLDSWNQRTDELYYNICLFTKDHDQFVPKKEFLVKTWSKGDTVIEDEDLFLRLKQLARNGTSNL